MEIRLDGSRKHGARRISGPLSLPALCPHAAIKPCAINCPTNRRTSFDYRPSCGLANALDVSHDGHIRRVKIENAGSPKRRANGFLTKPAPLGKNEALVIGAEGYADGTPTSQAVAAERYLLETVLRRPLLVKAGVHGSTHTSPSTDGPQGI